MMGNLGGKLCLNLLVSVNRLVSIPIDYIHRLPSLSPQKLFLSLGEMSKNRKKLVPELSLVTMLNRLVKCPILRQNKTCSGQEAQ